MQRARALRSRRGLRGRPPAGLRRRSVLQWRGDVRGGPWLRPFVRFPTPPTPLEAEKQWDQREKYLAIVSLPTADWDAEEQAEDWFDAVGRVVTQHGLCVEVFGFLVSRYLIYTRLPLSHDKLGSLSQFSRQ